MKQGPKSRYGEKLLDPRWQKKRLQILERDGWRCQGCCASDSTLHVHHIAYKPDCEPWEIDDDLLLTLCADCHETESAEHRSSVASILLLLAKIDVRTSYDLDILFSNIDLAYCDAQTGDWQEAWREGLRRHFAGWPFRKDEK